MIRSCNVPGCLNPASEIGLCEKHRLEYTERDGSLIKYLNPPWTFAPRGGARPPRGEVPHT